MGFFRLGGVGGSQLRHSVMQLGNASQQISHGFLNRLEKVLVSGRKCECKESTTMFESHANSIYPHRTFAWLCRRHQGPRWVVFKGLETQVLDIWHGRDGIVDICRQLLACSGVFPLGNHSCRVLESCTPITLHIVLELLGIVLVLPRTESLSTPPGPTALSPNPAS